MQSTSKRFKLPSVSEWNSLISLIDNHDTDGVRERCQLWGNIPILLQSGPLKNRPSPMCVAASLGSAEIVDILVKNGFHPNYRGRLVQDHVMWFPIQKAAMCGHRDVVKKFVQDFNVPADSTAPRGLTPLLWAVTYGHTDVVRYLISAGANVNVIQDVPKGRRLTPLSKAVQNGNTDIAILLLDSGADVNLRIASSVGSVLNKAVTLGTLDMVKLLHTRGGRLDVTGHLGHSILHYALGPRPNIYVVSYLISLNVSMDVVTRSGHTPLFSGLLAAADWEVTLKWLPLLLHAGHPVSREEYSSIRTCLRFSAEQMERLDDLIEDCLCVPKTLQQLCCFRIRRYLGVQFSKCVDYLPLPLVMKEFLCLKHHEIMTN